MVQTGCTSIWSMVNLSCLERVCKKLHPCVRSASWKILKHFLDSFKCTEKSLRYTQAFMLSQIRWIYGAHTKHRGKTDWTVYRPCLS